MEQICENDRKPSFGPNFGPFGPNFGSKIFFRKFYLYQKLEIVGSYYCMQFQGKLMNQTLENGKKTSFRPDFGPFSANSGDQIS